MVEMMHPKGRVSGKVVSSMAPSFVLVAVADRRRPVTESGRGGPVCGGPVYWRAVR
ncbi:hypothetical protein PDE01_43540 [Paracoccus denitrificans]|nr:hypothetical protein PDE01_43540 [Paracoccus denitrificans]